MLLEELLGLLEADGGYTDSTRTPNDIAHQKGKLGHSLSGNTTRQRYSTYRGDDEDDYNDPSWERQAPPITKAPTKTELMSASDKAPELTDSLKRAFGPKLLKVYKSYIDPEGYALVDCRVYIDYTKQAYLDINFKFEDKSTAFARYLMVSLVSGRHIYLVERNSRGQNAGRSASEIISKLAHLVTDVRKLMHEEESHPLSGIKFSNKLREISLTWL